MTIFISKVMWVGITTVLAALLLLGVVLALKGFTSRADVPILETPAWAGRVLVYGDQLLLRRENSDGETLLLKHINRDTVYRYDKGAQALVPVTELDWQRAAGPIAECGKQFPPSMQVLDIDIKTNKLVAGKERVVPTAGRTALGLTISPSGRWVAVLSTSGHIRSSIIPFTRGAPTGQHYLQVMSLPDAAPVGDAVRVPRRRGTDSLDSCWSADERTVVSYNILFDYLSVIETGLTLSPKQ